MDYDDVANLTNLTFDKPISPEVSRSHIAHEIIFMLIAFFAICCDGFMIHVIFKYKKLRTVPNLILANWAIADICSLIVTPSGYRIISVIDLLPLSSEFICILLEAAASLHLTTLIFLLVVLIDWCLGAYFEKVSEKFRYYYKFIIAAIWVFGLLICSVTSGYCIAHYMIRFATEYLMFSCYIANLLFVIVLQSYRGIQKCRKVFFDYPPLMLKLVTASVGCWFLGFIGLVLLDITRLYHPVLEMIGICFIFCTGIVNFIVMYRNDKHFQACFLLVLRRSKHDYEEADFSFENPVRKPIVRNSVLSFDNDQVPSNLHF